MSSYSVITHRWRLLLLVAIIIPTCRCYRYKPKQLRCERITIPMCANMRYNLTQMPNPLGHTNQKEAGNQIHEFLPLVQIGCSRLLRFFLCSQFAPMCTEQVDETLVIPPCRSLCLQVKASCEPLLLRFNFHWPPALDCDPLPEKSDRIDLCIEPPKEGELVEDDDAFQAIGSPEVYKSHWLELEGLRGVQQPTASDKSGQVDKQPGSSSLCPAGYVHIDKSSRVMLLQQQQLQNDAGHSCAPRCDADILFGRQDKRFMETWMTVWSTLSLASSMLTFFTFLIDLSRFPYPERPIVFISLCCIFYSAAHVARVVVGGRVVSCESSAQSPGVFYRIEGGLESVWCTVVFVLLYYFGMAGYAWWVILTITWYLASWRKWGGEAIAGLANVFHLVAWSLPAIKTIVVLALRNVDGEELTGLCYVGGRDDKALAAFLLTPLAMYLFVGIGFTAAGFVAVCRIRLDLKKGGANIGKLERLMAKMETFSVLYAVPGLCVFGCLVYEYRNLSAWHQESFRSRGCAGSLPPEASSSYHNHQQFLASSSDCSVVATSMPAPEVYLVKVFMSTVTGITTGMWIWSCKTIASWKDFLRTTFCCVRRKYASSRRSFSGAERRGQGQGQGHGGDVVHPVDQRVQTTVFPMNDFSSSSKAFGIQSTTSRVQTRV